MSYKIFCQICEKHKVPRCLREWIYDIYFIRANNRAIVNEIKQRYNRSSKWIKLFKIYHNVPCEDFEPSEACDYSYIPCYEHYKEFIKEMLNN